MRKRKYLLLMALKWTNCHFCQKMFKRTQSCEKYCSYECARKSAYVRKTLPKVTIIPQKERKILNTTQIFKSSMFPTFLKGFLAGGTIDRGLLL